uniref:U3 small nucleolar ribonucleoprotein protein IMP3 n=1 Tax=Plectus sambesii TaxID=2011161 RepID=A0A914UQD8_9BILA
MVRKLKFHEQKLLKKVDFISWEVDNNLHETKVMRRFHLKKREEYTLYNRLSREIRELAKKVKELDPKDPFRSACTSQLLTKLYDLGLTASKDTLERCDGVSASSFCRRRLPVLMAKTHMAETVTMASQFVEQGHIRVGPELITDPAFLVSRNLEDFVTWTNSSAIKKHVLDYADMRDDFDLA